MNSLRSIFLILKIEQSTKALIGSLARFFLWFGFISFLLLKVSTGWALAQTGEIQKNCLEQLKVFQNLGDDKAVSEACSKVVVAEPCSSVEKVPIFHFDRAGDSKSPKKILVFSMIHGDESGAGVVGKYWMQRLDTISPRNTWRVVPVLNPDGVRLKTRTNANKIDLNRNFPTKDWEDQAQKYWKISAGANPRRFPGESAGSEPETKCALHHIEDFKPDFIISVHTPLNVLDYDGPKVPPPKFDLLPWRSLGHFPGSLGRYMWHERKTPVLTMELNQNTPKNSKPFEQLQDLIGTLVMYDMKN